LKYTSKEIEGNVNVSSHPPLKEFLKLSVSLLVIFISVYIILGFAVDLIVPRLPPEVEDYIGSFFSERFVEVGAESEEGGKLQALLDDLAKDLPREKGYYKVSVVDNVESNAMAMPGGNIVIFSQLIKEAKSENEIVFVLGHELGHYANKDHLKGLGRGLVLASMSIILLGSDSSVTDFLMNSLTNIEMKFSRDQEAAADLFALELLNKKYGHVAGATDFFKTISAKDEHWRALYYFATHPHPEDRIEVLEAIIKDKNYLIKEKVPLKKLLDEGAEAPPE
jgi:predicted Zn-dependent protease